MKRRILFAMVLFGFALCASAQKVTAVRFQRLWDGERVIDGALVLIENGRKKVGLHLLEMKLWPPRGLPLM